MTTDEKLTENEVSPQKVMILLLNWASCPSSVGHSITVGQNKIIIEYVLM